jgi:elongation factor Tu
MPIDQIFNIRGRGTVVVGTIETGTVVVGEQLRLGDRETRCDGIERYRDLPPSAAAGDSVGILLGSLDVADAAGQVLTSS